MSVIKIGKGDFGSNISGNNLEQSGSANCTSDIAELRGSDGEYAGVALYAKRVEYQIEVAIGPGASPPTLGSGFGGISGVVTGVTRNHSNSSYQTFTVNITDYGISS